MNDCWNKIGVWGDGDDRCPELVRVSHCRNCEVYISFGRQQLDRPPTSEYLQGWTEIIAKSNKRQDRKKDLAFVFRAGLEWMALPANVVQEVVDIVDIGVIHSLPHRKSRIFLGLVNVRGKLELCFAIGALLGIQRAVRKQQIGKYLSPERLIVAEYKKERVVFPVSEVYGSVKYSADMLEQLPANAAESQVTFVSDIIRIDGEIGANFLDVDVLFEALTKSVL